MSNRTNTFRIPLRKALVQQYRNVFSGSEGKSVLAHILMELGTFIDLPDMSPEDYALKNYGARILRILGAGEVSQHAIDVFVQGLMNKSIPEDIKEETF